MGDSIIEQFQQMTNLNTKFEYSLKNAERILELMKNTHRQRISEREEEADNTFQYKDDLTLPMVRSVAERLEHQFFVSSLKEYSEHMGSIQDNQDNAFKVLEKLTEKHKELQDADQIIQRSVRTNDQLDQEILKWEEQDRRMSMAIKEEEIAQMMILEQAQKDIRGILDAEYIQNWERAGFATRWNSYLSELKEPFKPIEVKEEAKEQKLIKKSSIEDSVQETRSLKRSTNDTLLGDLKEFSRNLKIPKKKT